MERIKQMNLKKALVTITFMNITIALVLSLLSIWGCVAIRSQVAAEESMIGVRSDSNFITQAPELTKQEAIFAEIISIVQVILPILIYIIALVMTASIFYRLKLKKPLEMLTNGAAHIIENDLDFRMETTSQDELGQLCTAFETMRKTLFDNNRELWRQAEERKRLNAAFSHNLRNPVTVLKGSVKLAKKGMIEGTMKAGQITDHLSRIENYTGRIERYIETMSNIQRLEEIPIEREFTPWNSLISELEHVIRFTCFDSDKKVTFRSAVYTEPVLIDKSVLFQIAENLVSNAFRFAVQNIDVFCSVNEMIFEFSVTDDGCSFPDILIKMVSSHFKKERKIQNILEWDYIPVIFSVKGMAAAS